jgi:succinyl-diaminopimelate desuccinylase
MQVTNVTPNSLEMMFNVRNSTKTTTKEIEAFVEKHFKDMNYTLTLDQTAFAFVTSSDTKIVKDISQAIEEITEVKTKYSTAGGTSDARFIAPYGVEVIEFGVKNDTIHSVNERTTAREVEDLYKIFKRLIEIY